MPGVYCLNALCKLLIRMIHGMSELDPMRFPQLLSPGLFITLLGYKVCTIHSCLLAALGSALVSIGKYRYSSQEGCCGELGEDVCSALHGRPP